MYYITEENKKKAMRFGFWISVATFLLLGFTVAILGALKYIVFEHAILMVFLNIFIAFVVGSIAESVKIIKLAQKQQIEDELEEKKKNEEISRKWVERKEDRDRIIQKRREVEENKLMSDRILRQSSIGSSNPAHDVAEETMLQAQVYAEAESFVASTYSDDTTRAVDVSSPTSYDTGCTSSFDSTSSSSSCSCD